MVVKASLNNLRIAPRKVRLVADLIRGKRVDFAQAILGVIVKKAAQPISKLLQSAVANAENNFHLDKDNLYISKIMVNEGRKLRRWRARSRGQAFEIQKKTSHIILELKELQKAKKEKGHNSPKVKLSKKRKTNVS